MNMIGAVVELSLGTKPVLVGAARFYLFQLILQILHRVPNAVWLHLYKCDSDA
jgi:hypothetical protein